MEKICKKHGKTNYSFRLEGKKKRTRCKKCSVEAVQRRRNKIKVLAVEYKGGKCKNCGYNKCVDALEFHHINSKEKSFGIAKYGHTRSWEAIKRELDKCDMICSNCHKEEHYKIRIGG